jgi:phage host-nuclease inhibitor protein Gam
MIQSLADPEVLLSDVLNYIEEAHSILERGEWVDLKGLDARVERLCHEIVLLTPQQGREYAAELEFLREKLNALQESMQAQVKQLKDDMKETGTVQRANRAYAQGGTLHRAVDKPGE